jgi:hypothetical protein
LGAWLAGAPFLAAAEGRAGDSPVTIVVPAQLLAAEIRIDSPEQTWTTKIADIDQARRFIQTAASSAGFTATVIQPLISHHPLYWTAADTPVDLKGGAADVVIQCPIDATTDLVRVIQQLEGIISRLNVENKVLVSIGKIYMTINDPESMRAELLRRIGAYVAATSKALSATPDYSIIGLAQAVRVRPWGERDVEVYIPFAVTFGLPKG